MLIANPIYDVVFKRLMENEKVAKFFIGIFLDATVEELSVRPQEFTYVKEEGNKLPLDLTVFRLDFIALIRLENGETQKILIEIQKAGKEVDLMRFRNYLGEQYKKEDSVGGKKEALPIKAIYILGFKLPTIESPCLHIERQYRDMLTDELIEKRSHFIERLTHDSYVVQVDRIGGKHRTKLEKLLSFFEQAHFIDDNSILKNYPYDLHEEEFKLMVDILHHTGTDPETRKEIETEKEAWRMVNAMFGKREQELVEELEKKEEALEEKEAALEEKDAALEQERQEKEKERQEKEKAHHEKEQLLKELEKLKKKLGGD